MSEKQLNLLIAKRITYFLSEQGKTQQDLATHMNVSQATVSNWCKGIKMPRMDKIDKICSFLNCQRTDLMISDNANSQFFTIDDELEQEHIRKYRLIDQIDKEMVDAVLDKAYERYLANKDKP